jgi:hypothetical protein
MRYQELRDKVLGLLGAEGDPKTVKDKVKEKAADVAEKLGHKPDEIPVPEWKKIEKSTGQKVKDKLGKVGGKVRDAPGKIAEKITDKAEELKDKHADAKKLVDQKNAMGYKGEGERGRGSVLKHFLRGESDTEKSYAKVRKELSAQGAGAVDAHSFRTKADADDRKKSAKEQTELAEKENGIEVSPEFVRLLGSLSDDELDHRFPTILGVLEQSKNDPLTKGNLAYLEFELQRRGLASRSSILKTLGAAGRPPI